jgi:ferrous iron transport protein B
MSTGYMIEFDSLQSLKTLLVDNGWTWLTAINMMLFSLLHWPCATSLLSAFKETGSKKWTFMAFIIPAILAFAVCFIVTQTAHLLSLA